MITLTKAEKKLEENLINILKIHKGQENMITPLGINIASNGKSFTNRVLARILLHIQENDLLKGLVVLPEGFFIANTVKEYHQYQEQVKGHQIAKDPQKIKELKMF